MSKAISKVKLLECMRALENDGWINKRDLIDAIESGTFDLSPTDGEELKWWQIERDKVVRQLSEKDTEIAEINGQFADTCLLLNQAVEALEEVKRVTKDSEAYTDGAKAHYVAHSTIQSIKGTEP